jgi:ATP-dependent Clp protease protease subunit
MTSMIQDKDDITYSPGDDLKKSGIYTFMGDVDENNMLPIIEWILHENYIVKQKKKKELILMICSRGGNIEEAFALIDVMKSSNIPIKTVGLGQIASCGLLIFLAGTQGRRVLTPNTSILSHQYSWGSDGKHHELFAITKEFGLTQQRMINHYRETTGLYEETIKTKLLPPNDVWLSAQEALELGICNHIANISR